MSSGASLDVVLWGERATSFPAEQLHKDGQHSPQIVIFVGTLVRGYAGAGMYI
jgi:replication factor A1